MLIHDNEQGTHDRAPCYAFEGKGDGSTQKGRLKSFSDDLSGFMGNRLYFAP
ncbi:hypothetical protein HMPREF1051_0348 [Neisseria sicca VK64]|uniref:Uncharacterized protein n=1 Tax=Neisseria sicca VK64 TaxID=1095748 RepID=I2NW04_NEISI|nr:hypothetical protein HMPREF1051_0348 [Neisseria sicca VK64]